MATLEAALHADIDMLRLFNASLCEDSGNIDELAAASGADAEALHAVAGLLLCHFSMRATAGGRLHFPEAG